MDFWDRLRQIALFTLGVGALCLDLLTGPPHDWVILLVAFVLMGMVPVEYVLRHYQAIHTDDEKQRQ